MVNGFCECSLDDLAEFRNGKAVITYSPEGQVPVFGANGQIGRTDIALYDEPVIIIGRVGAYCGAVYRSFSPSWITDNAIVATPRTGIDFGFLYYRLLSLDLARSAIGSAQPLMTQSGLKLIQTIVPSLDEQRAIAGLLGALDEKVGLNRRLNEMLEAIARAIFKSWFVDFDLVHPTDGSPIPSGWQVTKFAGVATVSRHIVNPLDFPNEKYEHYSIPAFDEGKNPVQELGSAIKSNKFLVVQDAVLLSKLNPRIPRVWMPDLSGESRAICSTEFIVLRPSAVSREYLYGLCSSQTFLEEFATMVTGTSGSHQRVKPEFVEEMQIILPDRPVVARYTKLVTPLHQRVAINQRENQTLAALRDILLPKLMSGEIRVREAEKQVGAAL